ncbi:MAG: hypothetical protein COU85_00290 [Candidatus Portnoybacteria bacterium CG10_big_fil_rev_8_21_14_0_10_44_7]|uniref:Uncharacterized protein n=1 Tax=Candidatus Portnoybacteria bacterium CG10_big_fil_rev_8_21_14_0_10_44_7 TaxID=1974816 RepID=A0A2M8KJI9_9BACT|nr:MAG: hypothetical protein COU85_00290 [Candidatus Portnoybacteria bacterium CG10_big_fil_rev_8_21_14_0_10_44_7]
MRSGGQKGRPARNASRSEAGGGLGGEDPEGVASRLYGVKIFARPRFRRFFFRRRRISCQRSWRAA